MSTHDSGGDIAVHFSVWCSVCHVLVIVSKYGYISLTIKGIAYIKASSRHREYIHFLWKKNIFLKCQF